MDMWRYDLQDNLRGVEKLFVKITQVNKIVLVGHVNPDGDCIGSITGLGGYLKDCCGKNITLVVPNEVPQFLKFLSHDMNLYSYNIHKEEVHSALESADMVICMDLNSLKRMDDLGAAIQGCGAYKALIDHHPNPDDTFELVYSYPQSSSTCELAYWIIKELIQIGGENIQMPYNVALSLYTGMMTDTNNFANSVLPSTFRMASELLAYGIDKDKLQGMVFGGYSESRMRLMGDMLLNKMTIYNNLGASVMVITKEDKAKYNFAKGDSEGFVNLPLNIKDIHISALFTEDDDYIRVSLRSKDDFPVNKLSNQYFNGGGHQRAAGGKLVMAIGDVEEYFVKCLTEFKQM